MLAKAAPSTASLAVSKSGQACIELSQNRLKGLTIGAVPGYFFRLGYPLIPRITHTSDPPGRLFLYDLLFAWRWDEGMRIVAENLEKAAEFDELARSTTEPALKKRYADLAESYSLLAIVRRRLIETGAPKPEQ
jgi:hypothetical protein